MARKYHVKGTNDFKYWAVALLALGIWFTVDGWFPSQKWVDKYGPSPEGFLSVREFYGFNRFGAIFAFIGSAVCAYIHRVVK